ncbi:hypothetical protein QQF64_029430 [Cirrhinus molitorella]|uniref:Uncharacterized protein n=1 Tax=Cirrhinus molitorella TaxID=172907 RepID=A0ABR3N0K2_9TELE
MLQKSPKRLESVLPAHRPHHEPHRGVCVICPARVYDLLLELRARVTRGGGGASGSSRSARGRRAERVPSGRRVRRDCALELEQHRRGTGRGVTSPARTESRRTGAAFKDAVKHFVSSQR